MTELCVVMAVYGQPMMLHKQLSTIAGYDEVIRKKLSVIVVDDHGTPAVTAEWCAEFAGVNLHVYRVKDDIKWHQMGARNLGMTEAPPTWCLMIDPDMVFREAMMVKVLFALRRMGPNEVVRYGLKHVSEPDRPVDMTSPNTYLIHRNSFFAAGGYDETFRGNKGWSDVQMLDVLKAHFKLSSRPDIFADFYSIAQIPDAAVHTLDRSTKHNKQLRIKRTNEARKAGGWRRWVETKKTPNLQFQWSKVYPNP